MPDQIDLEEPVRSFEIALGHHEIVHRLRAYVRNPAPVSQDDDRSFHRQPGHRSVEVRLGVPSQSNVDDVGYGGNDDRCDRTQHTAQQ